MRIIIFQSEWENVQSGTRIQNSWLNCHIKSRTKLNIIKSAQIAPPFELYVLSSKGHISLRQHYVLYTAERNKPLVIELHLNYGCVDTFLFVTSSYGYVLLCYHTKLVFPFFSTYEISFSIFLYVRNQKLSPIRLSESNMSTGCPSRKTLYSCFKHFKVKRK